MAGRWYALAAAATLVVAACSERDPESTTGPQFVGAPSGPCDISNSVVNAYFPPSRQSFINSLKQSMVDAGHGTATARTFGFQIMDSIGSVSRNFSVDPSAGAQLTIALIGCMFDESATFTYPPEGATLAFTNALTSTNGGAYYVRGGGTNGADATGRSSAILGRITPPGGADGNLSGVAPLSGTTWTSMLAISQTLGKNVEQGVLFYGYPVGNPADEVFEWATVPSALTFSPGAVFTVCDFAQSSSSSTMVHEGGVGVLSFVSSGICSTPQQPLTFLEQGWGPKALAARLARAFAEALTPTTLQAAVLAGRTGGVSTVPKSRFGKKSVTALGMEWKDDPGVPSTWNGTSLAQARATSAYVSAIADGASEAVRFCAYLSGSNNNGTPTKLVKESNPQRDPECTTPPNGDPNALSVVTTFDNDNRSIADFGKVWVTKTGTITVTMMVVSGAVANGLLSTEANVKPAKK